MVILIKNTASTVGLLTSEKAIIGTNPLCIGLPDCQFIYDSSTSTVATNKLRLFSKQKKKFSSILGKTSTKRVTKDPQDILTDDGFLFPFSWEEGFWYKSFFLGVVIECLASLAGGKTGERVGKNKGKRLYSQEGMMAILVDKKCFPEYQNYLNEKKYFFKDLERYKVRLPGTHSRNLKKIKIYQKDWEEVCRL